MNIDIQAMERETQNRFHFLRLLGQGSFGVVFEAEELKTGRHVAVKRIDRLFDSITHTKRVLREIRILSHLYHENITNLVDVAATTSFADFNALYIAMDLMDTDLGELMRKTRQLNIDHHRFIIYQIARALKYLHSANVVHRDLKPGNLFVDSESRVKIGDFGLARVVDDPYAPDLQSEAILTRWYRAPEVLLNMKNYGNPMDIWSVGCVLAEMMLGRPLFQGQSNINMLTLMVEVLGSPRNTDFQQITNPSARKFMDALPKQGLGSFDDLFRKYDPVEVDLLRRMLTWNPEERITVEEILRHEFLSQFHDPFDEPVTLAMEDFEFERPEYSAQDLKRLLWQEIQKRR